MREAFLYQAYQECVLSQNYLEICTCLENINTSIYINPIQESRSQNELNRVINELETERLHARIRTFSDTKIIGITGVLEKRRQQR